MKELVLVKGQEVYCDSQIVSDKFGKRHSNVIRKIEQTIKDYSQIKGLKNETLKFIKTEGNYRNQKYEMYLMDKKAFTILAMGFTGKEALLWKCRFADAFFEMEKIISRTEYNKSNFEFQQARTMAIENRKEETDTIKQFVEYATKQGSQNAKYYYKHITSSAYKHLHLIQHKQPKLRETMDFMQVNQLILAEKLIKESLEYHMQNGEHYKTIFVLINQELEKFAESLHLERKRVRLK